MRRRDGNYAKTYVEISILHIISAILTAAGFVLLMYGLYSCYRYNTAKSISAINTDRITEGRYVKGKLTKYIGKEVDGIDGENFYGVSRSVYKGLTKYDVYTIPTFNKKYIALYVNDNDTLDKLETYNDGVGSSVEFVGQVIKDDYQPNYEFWQDSGLFEGQEDMNSKLFSKYVVKEIDYSKRLSHIYQGLSLWLVALILFNLAGRINIR